MDLVLAFGRYEAVDGGRRIDWSKSERECAESLFNESLGISFVASVARQSYHSLL
jgi:hypothetical protein